MTTETTTGTDPDHWNRILDDGGVTTIPVGPRIRPAGATLEVDLPPSVLTALPQYADDVSRFQLAEMTRRVEQSR